MLFGQEAVGRKKAKAARLLADSMLARNNVQKSGETDSQAAAEVEEAVGSIEEKSTTR